MRKHSGLHVKCAIFLFDFDQITEVFTATELSKFYIVCTVQSNGLHQHSNNDILASDNTFESNVNAYTNVWQCKII